MIVQTFLVILILSVALICDVTGASYSNVYVESEFAPIGYYSYGTPYPSIANPRLSQINSLPSAPGYIAPCVSPCVYPAQTVATPVNPSSNILTYNAPSVPIVVAPTKQEATGYEYSYVVYDENTGDHKAQRELSDGSVVRGEYSFLQPDGYVRQVQYVADDISGFNAVVKQFLPAAVEDHRKVKGQKNKESSPPCHETKNESLKEESEKDSGAILIKKIMKIHEKHSDEESAEKSKGHHGTSKESGEEENSKEKHHKETKKTSKEESGEESEAEYHENQSKKPKHSKEVSEEESEEKSKEKPHIKPEHTKEESGEESEEKPHIKPKHSKDESGEESQEKSKEKHHNKSKKVFSEESGEESEEKPHIKPKHSKEESGEESQEKSKEKHHNKSKKVSSEDSSEASRENSQEETLHKKTKKESKESGEEDLDSQESKEELKEKSRKESTKGTEDSRERNKNKSQGSKEGSNEDSGEESGVIGHGKHKEVHGLLKPNQEDLVPYNAILRCIEAAMRRNYGVPAALREEPSPLTYIVLNKPC